MYIRSSNFFLIHSCLPGLLQCEADVKKGIKNTVGLKLISKKYFKQVFYYSSLSAFDEKCLKFSSFEALCKTVMD
jgi:hypothetical protein